MDVQDYKIDLCAEQPLVGFGNSLVPIEGTIKKTRSNSLKSCHINPLPQNKVPFRLGSVRSPEIKKYPDNATCTLYSPRKTRTNV